MSDKRETYEVDVSHWSKDKKEFINYTVTCQQGGLIIDAPFGYKQFKGANIRDIIKDYQDNDVGYHWSKTSPYIRKGYSVKDAQAIASGQKKESECQIMPKPS